MADAILWLVFATHKCVWLGIHISRRHSQMWPARPPVYICGWKSAYNYRDVADPRRVTPRGGVAGLIKRADMSSVAGNVTKGSGKRCRPKIVEELEKC